jgi:hypothetical protein
MLEEPLTSQSNCGCLQDPHSFLKRAADLGMDRWYAEISIWVCPVCRRRWLQYLYEVEAFSASGRWYLGPLDTAQVEKIRPDSAKSILESLPWYYYGGSYFGGQPGKSSGEIYLTP